MFRHGYQPTKKVLERTIGKVVIEDKSNILGIRASLMKVTLLRNYRNQTYTHTEEVLLNIDNMDMVCPSEDEDLTFVYPKFKDYNSFYLVIEEPFNDFMKRYYEEEEE